MTIVGDWRTKFREYLENPNKKVPHKTKAQAHNFVLLEGELYKKGFGGLSLKCLSFPNSMEVMKQVHEGVCGAHQSGVKMRWLIRKHDYFLADFSKRLHHLLQRLSIVPEIWKYTKDSYC